MKSQAPNIKYEQNGDVSIIENLKQEGNQSEAPAIEQIRQSPDCSKYFKNIK
jgi:hypothetical protein